MKKNVFKIIAISFLVVTQQSLASSDICNRASFTHEQLSDSYAAGTKKVLETYHEKDADQITRLIEGKASKESYSYHRPCLSNTKYCSGQDQEWTYSKEIVQDIFGTNLRFNGVITSRQYSIWPANDLYYAHQTQIGYSCSWGGNLESYCEKWCSLTVVDDRFHD